MTTEQEKNIKDMAKLSETINYIIEKSHETGMSVQDLCNTIASMAVMRMHKQELASHTNLKQKANPITSTDDSDNEDSLFETYDEEAEVNGGYSNQS